jgi:hypothetical protein
VLTRSLRRLEADEPARRREVAPAGGRAREPSREPA